MRAWQPAFPQAMQRHGGRTRPMVPSGKSEVAPALEQRRDSVSDDNVKNVKAAALRATANTKD